MGLWIFFGTFLVLYALNLWAAYRIGYYKGGIDEMKEFNKFLDKMLADLKVMLKSAEEKAEGGGKNE